jgi:hypothetical protein
MSRCLVTGSVIAAIYALASTHRNQPTSFRLMLSTNCPSTARPSTESFPEPVTIFSSSQNRKSNPLLFFVDVNCERSKRPPPHRKPIRPPHHHPHLTSRGRYRPPCRIDPKSTEPAGTVRDSTKFDARRAPDNFKCASSICETGKSQPATSDDIQQRRFRVLPNHTGGRHASRSAVANLGTLARTPRLLQSGLIERIPGVRFEYWTSRFDSSTRGLAIEQRGLVAGEFGLQGTYLNHLARNIDRDRHEASPQKIKYAPRIHRAPSLYQFCTRVENCRRDTCSRDIFFPRHHSIILDGIRQVNYSLDTRSPKT